jgi:hypothetical protein
LHGARPLHGEPSLRARDVLLPSYVRRVPWITSVKHRFVAPETLRQLYAGKNLHRVKISRKTKDFENSPGHTVLLTLKPDRLTQT